MATADQSSEQDPTVDQGAIAPAANQPGTGKDEFYEFLDVATKREFKEEEITQSITIKFLMQRLRENAAEIFELRKFQQRSYELDRDLQVERGKSRLTKGQEIVSVLLTSGGGVGVGISTKVFDVSAGAGVALFVVFSAVIGAGIYLKVITR